MSSQRYISKLNITQMKTSNLNYCFIKNQNDTNENGIFYNILTHKTYPNKKLESRKLQLWPTTEINFWALIDELTECNFNLTNQFSSLSNLTGFAPEYWKGFALEYWM